MPPITLTAVRYVLRQWLPQLVWRKDRHHAPSGKQTYCLHNLAHANNSAHETAMIGLDTVYMVLISRHSPPTPRHKKKRHANCGFGSRASYTALHTPGPNERHSRITAKPVGCAQTMRNMSAPPARVTLLTKPDEYCVSSSMCERRHIK
jgi:hypothetical protein